MIEAALRRPRLSGRLTADWIPFVAGLAAIATVAVGQTIKATGGRLGAPFPPLYMYWAPRVGPLTAVAVLVLGLGATLAPVVIWRVRGPALLGSLYALALALGIGLNVSRDGVHGLWKVFDTGPGGLREAAHEYLPGLPALGHGLHYYVSHFPALIPSLPIHVEGNPPGPLIALHLLGIDTPGALAALCIGIGALTAPLAYDLGRTLGGEARGRTAGVLAAFSPALLLLGVTSADYAFTALGMGAACLLVRERTGARVAGATLAAVITFFSWVLFAIPAWAVLVVLAREGRRSAIVLAFGCTLVTLCVYGALAVVLGYNPVATFKATEAAYRHFSLMRPYAFWLFGSPVAWGLALGLPIVSATLRAAAMRDGPALSIVAIVLISAVLGFTKAEAERIWLPFVPLACVAAAAAIPTTRLRLVLWLLAAQAVVVELLFNTVW